MAPHPSQSRPGMGFTVPRSKVRILLGPLADCLQMAVGASVVAAAPLYLGKPLGLHHPALLAAAQDLTATPAREATDGRHLASQPTEERGKA
jgi:hypothetical protein